MKSKASQMATPAKVETREGPAGTYLTDGSGRTLYLFEADHGSTSACSGACVAAWPPLAAKGTPAATGSAKASELGIITLSNGAHQVTYGGHPLYRFSGDRAAGDINGQGLNAFGAKWWMVSPSGSPITQMASGSPSPSSGSSGGY